jgi:phosphate starvation-inducible PhoH-like protein
MRKPTQKKETAKVSEPKAVASTTKTFNIQKVSFELKCKNESQKKFVNMISDNTITICGGPAGSGKTFVACAQALRLLKKDDGYTKIILVKSVTELDGEQLGYLPGSIEDKLYPTMLSFLDNFYKIIGEDNTKRMLDLGMIEILPLAYIRGRSIDNAIIIVDEIQNVSLKNSRTILTRLGFSSKMILIGDSKQIDLKERASSSLDIIIRMFSNKENIGVMAFTRGDIVRNPIIMMIEDEFDKWEDENTKH